VLFPVLESFTVVEHGENGERIFVQCAERLVYMELDRNIKSLTPQEIKRKIDLLMEEFTMLGYSDPLVFLEQFSYFMFIKLLNEIYRKESEYPDAITSALIDSNMKNIDWALLKRLKGQEMVFYLKQNSFPFINDIGRTPLILH